MIALYQRCGVIARCAPIFSSKWVARIALFRATVR
jgi:hypothetical protein